MAFVKASKKQARLRMALVGPAGSGKTYTALAIGTALGSKVAVIDTERGSASLYTDKFSFDVCELSNFHPENYIKAIREAEAAGYEVLVIDSLTHAWNGEGGVLQIVEAASARAKNNTYAGWREGTPLQNALVDAILQSKCHVITTMRSKTEYVLENVNGRNVPKKVGMAPVQREGMDYEMSVVGELDQDNTLVVTKTRCEALTGAVIKRPGKELASQLLAWLTDGAPAPEVVTAPPAAASFDTVGFDLARSTIAAAQTQQDLETLIPKIKALGLPEVPAQLLRVEYANKKRLLNDTHVINGIAAAVDILSSP